MPKVAVYDMTGKQTGEEIELRQSEVPPGVSAEPPSGV